jgi:hypothetical protein
MMISRKSRLIIVLVSAPGQSTKHKASASFCCFNVPTALVTKHFAPPKLTEVTNAQDRKEP